LAIVCRPQEGLSFCETHRFAADQKTGFAALNPSYVLRNPDEEARIGNPLCAAAREDQAALQENGG
jgi:hypothetical protein